MKATLYKFIDKNNIEVVTSVNVMHHSTAVEKLRNSILNSSNAITNCKIRTETYTAKKSIESFFKSIGEPYFGTINAVITVTCSDYVNNVTEFYIVCRPY